MGATLGETGPATEELEIDLLLEGLFQCRGFDFRDYERSALRRKLHGVMRMRGLVTVTALLDRALHDPQASAALLRALSVQPVGLFDDPRQARLARSVMGANLHASAMPKVWVAECAGVGEAWSLAIMLAEEQLLARTEIFATVANEELLAEVGEAGIAQDQMAACQENYRLAGGSGRVADYFAIDGERALLLPQLRQRITWAQYNLVTDSSFNEFQLIVCRRALPDFGPVLRRRVLRLFHDSLALFGVLGIDRPLDDGDAFGAGYQGIFPGQAWYKRVA